jgi:DNA-binding transcriptional ArsR family regulator
LEVLKLLHNDIFENTKKEFFICYTNPEQSMFGAIVIFPVFSFLEIVPKNMFSFLGADNDQSQLNPRFKMILWLFVAGTRGGANRARILNLLQDTPLNAHKIAKSLNLDHKTVAHHLKILSKNDLVQKAEKTYGAEYQLSQIMNKNQNILEEIMEKIGTK